MPDSGSAIRQRLHGYCALCKSRCGCISVVENGRLVAVEPDPDHPTGAHLCAKGRAAPEIVHAPERLTMPLIRTAPKDAADPGWREFLGKGGPLIEEMWSTVMLPAAHSPLQ